MVNGVGHVHKLGKYNRHKFGVTNRPYNITLPNSSGHDKYNKIIDVGSKEPITA